MGAGARVEDEAAKQLAEEERKRIEKEEEAHRVAERTRMARAAEEAGMPVAPKLSAVLSSLACTPCSSVLCDVLHGTFGPRQRERVSERMKGVGLGGEREEWKQEERHEPPMTRMRGCTHHMMLRTVHGRRS